MGNSRNAWFAALLGALLAMFGAVRSASATDWKALKPLCGAVHQKEGSGDEASPACKAALATLPVDRQTCATICGVDGGTWDSEKSRCTITDAWPNLSPNGCLVAAHTWGGMGGGGVGAGCVDTDKDGVPDQWTPACLRDPKFADAAKSRGDSKGDNCRLIANGKGQMAIPGVGDQLDLHDATGGGGSDGVGDACQFSSATMAAEIGARVDALEKALGVVGDEKAKAAALAELARIKSEGGFASRKDIDRLTTASNVINGCLAAGQVPVLAVDGSPTGQCAENPELAAVKADVAKTDAAIHAVERRTATVQIVGVAEGFGKTYGVLGAQVDLVVRPSPETDGRLGVAVGVPVGTSDKDHAKVAMQIATGLDHYGYEGQTCRAGLGVEALLGAAYDADFNAKASSIGGRIRVPIQCGSFVVAPSAGPAYVTTQRESGVTIAYGLIMGAQW